MMNSKDRVGEAPAVEKEAKFLLSELPLFLSGVVGDKYEQTYLNYEDPEAMQMILERLPQVASMDVAEARIRRIEGQKGLKYKMTVKGDGGEERPEAEIEVDENFANQIVDAYSKGQTVKKVRSKFPMILPGLVLEVDLYADNLTGLITAEIEQDPAKQDKVYSREELAQALTTMLDGHGELVDVTDDKRFKNKRLAAMEEEGAIVTELIESVQGSVKKSVNEVVEVERKTVETKFGTAFQNESGQWRFQWCGGRAGTPPERALRAAASGLTPDLQKVFCKEVNGSLKEAGVDIVLVGGHVNPREYLG